jgi:hypothetical protein
VAETALSALVKVGLAHWETIEPGPRGGRESRVCVLVTVGDGDTTPITPAFGSVSSPVASVNTGDEINDLLVEAGDADGDAVVSWEDCIEPSSPHTEA